ncbi:MAG: hypothetical protein JXA46_12645, partial [Dehalococcoidales bacterium]|nr:hypothetical protein [Dehalococcoidales bacterium]
MEPRGNVKALSKSAITERRKNDIQEEEGLLERILRRGNLNSAYAKVKANKGSHGVDGMTVDELLSHLKQHGAELKQSILKGEYQPQPV